MRAGTTRPGARAYTTITTCQLYSFHSYAQAGRREASGPGHPGRDPRPGPAPGPARGRPSESSGEASVIDPRGGPAAWAATQLRPGMSLT